MEPLALLSTSAVIALALVGIVRGIDVRLVLLAAALLIGGIAGDLRPVVRAFLEAFSSEKYVIPICTAMGFAYVLKHTGCDTQLVNLLMVPLRRVRFLLIPGVVLSGFIVNIPVVSQTSTAVCLGTVVVPLMRAAGFSAIAIGASLLVGASIGGELLNPSAVELLAVKAKTGTDLRVLSWEYIPPLVFPVLVVSTGLLWWLCGRAGASDAHAVADSSRTGTNYAQAFVPLVPLALLFLSGPPLNAIAIPGDWVAVKTADTPNPDRVANSRLIGLAMLIGVAVAALAAPRKAGGCMKAFFDGAGYGFANVISLIVIAQCFGTALAQVGLAAELGRLVEGTPNSLKPLAAAVPCLFAVVCGSGIASSAALYPTFYDSSVGVGANPDEVGALVSVGSAVGRTLSPVSAVCLMCATLTGTKATDLSRRVALPLIAGLTVAVLLHIAGVWPALGRLFGGASP